MIVTLFFQICMPQLRINISKQKAVLRTESLCEQSSDYLTRKNVVIQFQCRIW